eukprot:CAMPEP_0201637798 /NCGR_PEP_ID=MMETSP0493-20130528/14281_1 /ASSEMBLY_ACC=CAM_ASM_000838 /TAXON_ID=420259 /ORGANISM="Thalassiosira gravida, Strain GMp14c1" /LENGTH=118 /DNA_ID=CAMNT_0048110555 /DNA_START=141 /DNA_END=497 /DNA_ORIENTATION=+
MSVRATQCQGQNPAPSEQVCGDNPLYTVPYIVALCSDNSNTSERRVLLRDCRIMARRCSTMRFRSWRHSSLHSGLLLLLLLLLLVVVVTDPSGDSGDWAVVIEGTIVLSPWSSIALAD